MLVGRVILETKLLNLFYILMVDTTFFPLFSLFVSSISTCISFRFFVLIRWCLEDGVVDYEDEKSHLTITLVMIVIKRTFFLGWKNFIWCKDEQLCARTGSGKKLLRIFNFLPITLFSHFIFGEGE